MKITRIASLDDADELAALVRTDRDFLAAFEPVRDEGYYTAAGQRTILAHNLEDHARGGMVPMVITQDGRVAGRINLNTIVRGAAQSAHIGYWLGQAYHGQGLASTALAETIALAFTELDLHRLEAGTMLHNTASQRVLTRNGFKPFAVSPRYLKIAGQWRDHILFHLFNPAHPD
ncbi:putative ribosomal-protein-alanine acetyltransferase [Catellatospora sp. TT07R-123]|uniref:GNAT family N-acetyltransferase n=1 Tax=Catellatospora sp. TT07R-123 TaxID=2733863 RepID=UPI001B163B3E|nr:GNAT family protein [Catellatospora sp. TT07R-123]GHJ44125.1 putative ribosomal-protein-alanine acetyltransferase [Catellatospora sp. TT07R-123]